MYVSKEEWDHFEEEFAKLLQISLSNQDPNHTGTIYQQFKGI
jgi:hypothetical protein